MLAGDAGASDGGWEEVTIFFKRRPGPPSLENEDGEPGAMSFLRPLLRDVRGFKDVLFVVLRLPNGPEDIVLRQHGIAG